MSLIGPFYFHTLMHPWVLIFVIGILILFAVECVTRAPGAISVSTGETLAKIRSDHRSWKRRLPAALRALGLIFLLVALARPLHGLSIHKEEAQIVDIMLCVDVSLSMKARDIVGGRGPSPP